MKESLHRKEIISRYLPEIIFVLSSGLHSSKASSTGVKPSWDARMRLVATADMVGKLSEFEYKPQVIITGGSVYKNQPELSSIGKSRLVDNYLPEEQVATRGGLNTIEEFELIAKLIKEQNLNPYDIAVISSGYHLTAQALAEQLGVRFFSAEEILSQRDRRYQGIIQDMVKSDYYQKLLKSQKRRSKVAKYPLGEMFYKIANKWVKRRVKLTPFDPGGLQKMFGEKQ